MLIIMVITRTEIVETGIAILIFHEAVLWAFSMTGKLHVTLLALAGKRTVFQTAELLLLLTIKHVDERMVTDIAQLILRKNKEKNDNGNKKRNSSRKETLWLT
jgi:mannitol/fructose-specific phosphotransferase system IIA component